MGPGFESLRMYKNFRRDVIIDVFFLFKFNFFIFLRLDSMKKTTYILLYVFAIVLTACTEVIVAQPADTLYSEKMVMSIYGRQPERALQIIDSAEILGNITDVRADYLRALVYSKAVGSLQFDTAILISERLMQNDEVLADAGQKQEVLEVLLNACRLRKDYEQALHWATQLSDLYRENGKETEALRTDAEIGAFLIRIGEQEEGLAKLDSVICHLDGTMKFNELDASIIALRRKAEICIEKGIYDQAITAAEHMLELLSDFEKHPDDYHDSSIREPSEASRPNYISFYRGKAYGYLAAAYTNTGNQNKARYYLSLYDNTSSGQSLTGRFMMTPTLEKLGEYDRVLAIYDEVERKLDNDTLNDNFARILKSRARIGEAQGRHAEANGYWRRYISITENLNEELLQGKAHLYAARFHAQEQQREIERQRDAAHRAEASRRVIVSISILIFLFAIYVWRQWRKTKKQNKILAQQITEVSEYKKRYRELMPVQPMEPLTDSPAELSDADLYVYLRDLIEHEQLFLNPLFERQTLIERTGLTKERIGAAFSQGSDHGRLTTLISDLRLDYAVRLMNEQPELSVERICQASGFANADTFTRNFKAKYGMTPTAYRTTLG